MKKDKYSIYSLYGEVLKEENAANLMEFISPGMISSPVMNHVRDISIDVLIENSPEKKEMFEGLVAAANGEILDFEKFDIRKKKPKIELRGREHYDIDDVDGPMYMLDHDFSGCFVVGFSKDMDESIYGKVVLEGLELPRGALKSVEVAGGSQMFAIPVRGFLNQYDTEYTLEISDFVDVDGNVMEKEQITIKTLPKTMPDISYAANDQVALDAAREGIVLLKNNNNILPLNNQENISIVGMDMFRIGAVGAGRINPRYAINLKRGINEYSDFKLNENADVGIVVISRASGENYDNNAIAGDYYLTDEEYEAAKQIRNNHSRSVAIINSGYPIDLRWTEKLNFDAVIWCGYAGMLAGRALVEILDGRVNPSGKLPDTWSNDYFDIPTSKNFYRPLNGEAGLGADCGVFIDTYYEEDIYVGYRYFETFNKAVAYPFGFGLSYTSFEVSGKYQDGKICCKVENTGEVSGKEVVQVYVAIPDGKLEQPSKRLIGFYKTSEIEPNDNEVFSIDIEEKNLSSFDPETANWIIEPGAIKIYIGNSVNNLHQIGEIKYETMKVVRESNNYMIPPVEIELLSKKQASFPKGLHTGIKEGINELEPKAIRKTFEDKTIRNEFVDKLTIEELARLSVCGSHGWGMHEKGEAGRLFKLENHETPDFVVADGNNGVNVHKPNIGMPCSNTVCATWNAQLAYKVGEVIAIEAKENEIDMILAPAMNIHRDPLNGRHPEYFSEDPYLAGVMAGNQSKGLEDNGISSCIKHTIANNCESSRKRNQSMISERAIREIYLKVFEVAISVHNPDSMMTGYNAVNGVFTAEDEEMIHGIFREEFGFNGYVMTDWNSYDSVDIVAAVQAGNCWLTPGSADNTFVTPLIEAVKDGKISETRLRNNIKYMMNVIEKRK